MKTSYYSIDTEEIMNFSVVIQNEDSIGYYIDPCEDPTGLISNTYMICGDLVTFFVREAKDPQLVVYYDGQICKLQKQERCKVEKIEGEIITVKDQGEELNSGGFGNYVTIRGLSIDQEDISNIVQILHDCRHCSVKCKF